MSDLLSEVGQSETIDDQRSDEVASGYEESEAPQESSSEPAEQPVAQEEISPDWMYATSKQDVARPSQSASQEQWDAYWQNQYYLQEQQRRHMQAQQPQQDNSGQLLEEFIRNPNGFIDRAVEQRLQSTVGPLAQNVAGVQQMTQAAIAAHAQSNISAAEGNIKEGYKKVLSKDAAFRGNQRIKSRVENYFQSEWNNAVGDANRGDFRRLQAMSHPRFVEGALALAKILEGYPPSTSGPASPGNAVVGGVRQGRHEQEVEISPDMESAIQRLGSGGRDRYLKALKETQKRGDFEIYG